MSFYISIASHSNQSSFNNILSASPFSSSISVIFSHSNPTLVNKKSTVSSSSYFYSNTSTFLILNQTSASTSTSSNSNPSSFYKKSTTISSSISSALFFNRSISRHSAYYLSSFAESSTSSSSFYMSITSYANASSSQLSESSFILSMTLSHSNPASIYNKSTAPSFSLFSSSFFYMSIIPYKKSSTSFSSLNLSISRTMSFNLLRKGILHSNISPNYSKLSSSSSKPSSNYKKSKLLLQSRSISSTPSSSFNLSRSILNSIIQKQILKSSYTSNLLRPTSSSLSPIFSQSSVSSFSSYLSTTSFHSELKSIQHQYYSDYDIFSPPSLSFCSSFGRSMCSSFSFQTRLLQLTQSSFVTSTSTDSFSISINPDKTLSSKLSSSSTSKLRNCQSMITTLSTLSCSSLFNVLNSQHISPRSISTSSINSKSRLFFFSHIRVLLFDRTQNSISLFSSLTRSISVQSRSLFFASSSQSCSLQKQNKKLSSLMSLNLRYFLPKVSKLSLSCSYSSFLRIVSSIKTCSFTSNASCGFSSLDLILSNQALLRSFHFPVSLKSLSSSPSKMSTPSLFISENFTSDQASE